MLHSPIENNKIDRYLLSMSGNDGIIILEAIRIFTKPMQLGNDKGNKQLFVR